MIHYRAELVLSEVHEYTDPNGYLRTSSENIARLDLTAGTPGSAMAQILPHVQQLTTWHTLAEAETAAPSTSDSQEEATA